jgi:phage terminase small subunit
VGDACIFRNTMELKDEIFCRAYVGECAFNATRAYLLAYPDVTEKSAGVLGHLLLKNLSVQDLIVKLMRERTDRLDIASDDVLRLLWQTVTADPNELVEVRRVPCRHCYGEGHLYQHTPAEWYDIQAAHRNACERAASVRAPAPAEPDVKGGLGYDRRFPPLPDCPECGGMGEEIVLIKDTRNLSPAGRQLYAGAKKTKDGLQILTHSRDKALELIGRHLAMFTDNVNHKNNGGSFQPMSLDQFYGKRVEGDGDDEK